MPESEISMTANTARSSLSGTVGDSSMYYLNSTVPWTASGPSSITTSLPGGLCWQPGNIVTVTDQQSAYNQLLQNQYTPMSYVGTKPVVVCNGCVTQYESIAEALEAAQSLAHRSNSDAYVLRPTTKVSPKRDVIVTEL